MSRTSDSARRLISRRSLKARSNSSASGACGYRARPSRSRPRGSDLGSVTCLRRCGKGLTLVEREPCLPPPLRRLGSFSPPAGEFAQTSAIKARRTSIHVRAGVASLLHWTLMVARVCGAPVGPRKWSVQGEFVIPGALSDEDFLGTHPPVDTKTGQISLRGDFHGARSIRFIQRRSYSSADYHP